MSEETPPTDRVTEPSVSDHLRPTVPAYDDGVYRVVGVDDDRVTLLRVTDEQGRRAHTGEVLTVSHEELSGFEPAGNPRGGRTLRAVVMSAPETAYWSFRAFGQQLKTAPLPAAIAAGTVILGLVGDLADVLPSLLAGILLLLGSLGLAYVGSGRA
ncbi:hypothetical protein [Halobellus clavatus]|uniref:Uncharacterized protein n=1 Tax=Halobellus clavatus TaxID=660517 RepID=A0A1H3HYF4_9EURY|nr:hypothetical protein [Halobellus clavatus]SDY20467.1 hypothetical protein SAMN04487946_108137 [Halobellus clavatus]